MAKVGLEGLAFAVPEHFIDMNELARARNVDPLKYTKGLGQLEMSVATPCEDPVVLAIEAGMKLLENFRIDPASIGLVIVGTETSVDQSKPISAYLHQFLNLSPQCRTIETKHACYGAMAGLGIATDWILSGRAQGKKALVVATDIARYGARSLGEPTQGAGAVAMLISDQPTLLELQTERQGYFSKQVMDFWRPNYSKEAFADGHYSIQCYLEALSHSYAMYTRHEMKLGTEVAAFLYHSPFVKMAQKAHMKFSELEHGSAFGEQSPELAKAKLDYENRVAPFLEINSRVGNIYTGSLFLSLINFIEDGASRTPNDAGKTNPKVMLFSYGSGCVSELITGTLLPGASETMSKNPFRKTLDKRKQISVDVYEDILAACGKADLDGTDLSPARWDLNGRFVYLGNHENQRRYAKNAHS